MCGSRNLSQATDSCRFRSQAEISQHVWCSWTFSRSQSSQKIKEQFAAADLFHFDLKSRFAQSENHRLVRKVNEGLLVHYKQLSSFLELHREAEEHLGKCSSGFSALRNSSFLLRYAENQTLKSSIQKFGWNAEVRLTQTEGSVAPLTVSGQLMQGILDCSLHRCMRKKMRKATRNHSVTTSKYWKAGQLGQPRVQNTHRKAMIREIWEKGNLF